LARLQATAGNRAVQRLLEDHPGDLDGAAISERIGMAEGAGAAIDPAVAHQLAQTLGADPGHLRIHTDPEADALSRDLGARAFTSGQDIFFRHGAFDPGTPDGFGLLAHEATHVLQQAAGPVDGTPTSDGALSISDPGDAFERAASAHDASGGTTATQQVSAADGSGRSVQRDDDWSAASLFGDARSLASGVMDSQKAAIDFIDTPFRGAAENIGKATAGISQGIDWAEDQEKAASKEYLPPELAAIADTSTQVAGGILDAGVTIGGGALETVVDPIGAAEKVIGMGIKAPSKLASGALDATGDLLAGKGIDAAGNDLARGVGDAVGSVWGGLGEGDDAAGHTPKDAGMVRQVLDPFYQDHAKGKDAHAVGRGLGTIGSFFLGGGEAGETAAGESVPTPAIEEAPPTIRDPIPSDEAAPTIRPNPDEVAPTQRRPALPDDLAPTQRRPLFPDEAAPTQRDPNVDIEPRVPRIRGGEAPNSPIIPRNTDFAAPGSPGFLEAADPLAPTQRVPNIVDLGGEAGPDTRPAFTERGIGPDFEQPPATRRDSGPPTLRDGPPTLRNGAAPNANGTPPAPDFGPPQGLFDPMPGDPEPAPSLGPLPPFRGMLPSELF
jgi:hypothetical protein